MIKATNIRDLEYNKFVESPSRAGMPAVDVSGNFSLKGLNIGGRITEMTIDDTAWYALPAVPLANRNAVSIHNRSGVECKINYDNAVVGYVGVIVPDGYERQYDITDNVVIYIKAFPGSGSVTVTVEELA